MRHGVVLFRAGQHGSTREGDEQQHESHAEEYAPYPSDLLDEYEKQENSDRVLHPTPDAVQRSGTIQQRTRGWPAERERDQHPEQEPERKR